MGEALMALLTSLLEILGTTKAMRWFVLFFVLAVAFALLLYFGVLVF